MEDINSIAIPGGSSGTTCGYCSEPGRRSEAPLTSFHSATLEAIRLSCGVYQGMIDRGWRRSGQYCYKPNLQASCCPQYTIKLDATAFKPSRSQRQILSRWNRFILYDGQNDNEKSLHASNPKTSAKPKKAAPITSLNVAIHESEIDFQTGIQPCHRFETILEPSSYTPEKFALYKKYQEEIHHDLRNSPSAFRRFLVDSPLMAEPIPYDSPPPSHLPLEYGSYHQLYKLDDELIAMSVIDILPNCVSSVYFMYDKDWERFSLGKLSALREASLAHEIREAGALEMSSLYMGFYIYSCPKMRYKGDYSPSYLADPESYEWFPLETCISLLQKYNYACFSQPSHSFNNDESKSISEDASTESSSGDPELEATDPRFDDVKIITRSEEGNLITKPINKTGYLSRYTTIRHELGACVRGLGTHLSKQFAFTF